LKKYSGPGFSIKNKYSPAQPKTAVLGLKLLSHDRYS